MSAAVKFLHTDDDGRSAYHAGAAKLDAKKQNAMYMGNYTIPQQQAAEALRRSVGDALSPRRVYITARKGFLAVKAENPNPCMTQNKAVERLFAQCGVDKVEVVQTVHGYIFRMFAK
jgi:hypothetical protein